MNADFFLSDLPDWDDNLYQEENPQWANSATHKACKALYKQWQEVVFLLKGVMMQVSEDTENKNAKDLEVVRALLADAYMVGAKIRSSEAGEIYILRMENAAIVRQLAQSIASRLLLFIEDESTDPAYLKVIRKEIDKFRKLFIKWVNTFEKDEFVDEWGLFV